MLDTWLRIGKLEFCKTIELGMSLLEWDRWWICGNGRDRAKIEIFRIGFLVFNSWFDCMVQ